MNIFSLVLKQMRQRALGTWLTLLSVTLGVALAITILVLYREAGSLFGQTDYGYDVLVGKKGSDTQLVMNTVYQLDRSPGNIPISLYKEMVTRPTRSPFSRRPTTGPVEPNYFQQVKIAIPYVVGDSYQGIYRIVGTTPNLFGYGDDGEKLPDERVMEYRPDYRYQFAQGRDFLPHKFEAIVGSEVARRTDLQIGKQFRATHGFPRPGETPDIHKTVWTVVGILAPTHTAADRVVFLPYESLYTIGEHELGMLAQMYIREGKRPPPSDVDPDDVKVYTQDPDGTFHLMASLPEEAKELSAILVKGRSPYAAEGLMYILNNGDVAQAVSPANVMRQFFDQFLKGPTLVLLAIAILVTVVAAVGILVSIYNSVSARLREIAILRALGATRNRVLSLICIESVFIGIAGGLAGLVAGHGLAGVASFYFNRYVGEGIHWWRVGSFEWCYLGGVVVVALLAGLLPAVKAYRTSVATNLVAG